MNIIVKKQYPFFTYGARFNLFLTIKGSLDVSLSHAFDMFGLDHAAEIALIQSHPLLSQNLSEVYLPDSRKALICLSLDCLPFWLIRIDPNEATDQGRRKILKLQSNMLKSLWILHSEDLPGDLGDDLQELFPTETD
jgi:hypothetical protein